MGRNKKKRDRGERLLKLRSSVTQLQSLRAGGATYYTCDDTTLLTILTQYSHNTHTILQNAHTSL